MNHVFVVDDGGEQYWYVATSEDDALAQHEKLNYGEATGVELTEDVRKDLSCSREPDDKQLRIEADGDGDGDGFTKKSAREWADSTEGFLGCTAL